jgi:hypothetical protein
VRVATNESPRKRNMASESTGGIGFFGLLAILFIGLKLTGCIEWSWWLVLLPLYGPPLAVLTIVGAVMAFAASCMVAAVVAGYFIGEK